MEQQPQEPGLAAEAQIQEQPEQAQRFKTLGVRIDEGLHAQLTFLAQLTGSTIADQIRTSLEARVRSAQEDPDLIARAEEVRAEIEREAEARKQAIAGLFGTVAVGSETSPVQGTSRGRRRSSDS